MNLIPKAPQGTVYNYYCTFSDQLSWKNPEKKTDGLEEVIFMRNRCSIDFFFGKDGILTAIPEEARKDILALLDDGWDVPMNTDHHGDEGCEKFGSFFLYDEKYPELAHLSMEDRLKYISDKVKELGYAGLGLWIPANCFEEDRTWDRAKCFQEMERILTEKAKMCAYADIKYLKVDWGWHGRDVGFRQGMTNIFKKYCPDIIMEHVIGIFGPAYDCDPEEQVKKPYLDFLDIGRQTLMIGDAYRTYDVTAEFNYCTTLMRIAKLMNPEFRTAPEYAGIINVEDNPVIAAALGMAFGSMSNVDKPLFNDSLKAARFQRLAPAFRLDEGQHRKEGDGHFSPAFGLGDGQNLFSKDLFYDWYHYHKDPTVWPYIGDEVLHQYAPTKLSRNAPLAEVIPDEKGEAPFVLTSVNPITGAFAVATVARCMDDGFYFPQADVRADGALADKPVGVFGHFRSLSLHFDRPITGMKVYAQDLAKDEAIDITDRVTIGGGKYMLPDAVIEGNVLTLDGKLIDELGKNDDPADESAPALVLSLVKED